MNTGYSTKPLCKHRDSETASAEVHQSALHDEDVVKERQQETADNRRAGKEYNRPERQGVEVIDRKMGGVFCQQPRLTMFHQDLARLGTKSTIAFALPGSRI